MAAAIKEIYEDIRRQRSDDEGKFFYDLLLDEERRNLHFPNEANNSTAYRLTNGGFEPVKWRDVAVGDVVRVEGGHYFPADMLLLSSSEPDGLCYVETCNLDGETNLKIKQARPETASILTPVEASQLQGQIRAEQPNNSLYTFEGTLQFGTGEPELPVEPLQLLLRGSMLRNTRWVYGVVVYTGHETKLMRNATAAPIKQTDMERATNVQILNMIVILFVLALASAVGAVLFATNGRKGLAYLFPETGRLPNTDIAYTMGTHFLTFIILYNTLIPISLIVTMEVVRIVNALLISSDLDMYHAETDTPAMARTSTLVEELGQVEYIFSDKTGTLTCNEMKFQKCSVDGLLYGRQAMEGDVTNPAVLSLEDLRIKAQDSDTAFQFLCLLAVCHTVVPERPMDDLKSSDIQNIIYQASSPDEAALVQGAREMDYIFHSRKPRSVTVRIGGIDREFMILNVCEFNSTRKRMSIVVRTPDGEIRLFTKGADTVIFERLAPLHSSKERLRSTTVSEAFEPSSSKQGRARGSSALVSPKSAEKQHKNTVKTTARHLELFASDGLRTLCLATRVIPESEYQEWSRMYEEAATTINNRQTELDRVAELIETDLELLGATAIEDRLQDGVPETIAMLASAGIKIWVLTGDRQETAINIGYSCRLLTPRMRLIIINETTAEATGRVIEAKLAEVCEYFVSRLGRMPMGAYDPESKVPTFFQRLFRTNVIRPMPSNPDADRPANMNVDKFALIIDGKSLGFALSKQFQKRFLALGTACKAVICCRVSPIQKAQVVKLVKSHLSAITLAIGDGANDVSMIQSAHVGVGISGREGMQAARSSDFTIAQFRFLQKLLLVHGLWIYDRLSKVILYCFYKSIALYVTQFWFAFFNGFSGQTVFESWLLASYNVFFTSLPVLAIGILDQFVSAEMLLRFPQVYSLGRNRELFNVKVFWSWTLNALCHSLLLFFLAWMLFADDVLSYSVFNGTVPDIWYQNAFLYGCILLVVTLKAALVVCYWTNITVGVMLFSVAFWVFGLWALSVAGPVWFRISQELTGVPLILYSSSAFWLSLVVMSVICLLRDFAWKFMRRDIWFKPHHIIQEIQAVDTASRSRSSSIIQRFRSATFRLYRGFAFSQNERGEADMIRHYDTSRPKPSGL